MTDAAFCIWVNSEFPLTQHWYIRLSVQTGDFSDGPSRAGEDAQPKQGRGIGYEYSKDRDWRVPRDPGTKSI
jgi:hypothetical protein